MKVLVGAFNIQPGEAPNRGLLRECEIFGNLRITFVTSSSMNSFLSLARIDELEMITDDGMVFGPVGGGGGGAFVAGPHPGRVKISVILSCKEQMSDCHVCRLLCFLLVWKCRISS